MAPDQIREAVALAIADSGTARGLDRKADAAIAAHTRALAEAGLVIVPRKASEGMLRAWCAAKMKEGADPDEQVPVPGTGQGDMQFWERWRDVADQLQLRERWQAMVAKAEEEMKDAT